MTELTKKDVLIRQNGVVYTRPQVVESILDLAGYTTDKQLFRYRVLEPAAGQGDFVVAVIRRLLVSCENQEVDVSHEWGNLTRAITAVEISRGSCVILRRKIADLLCEKGWSAEDIERLVSSWVVHADFLLDSIDLKFDFIVGNPPYVRQENIEHHKLLEYRRRFKTFFDRADLYIPFFEKSLDLLNPDGVLAFICNDRWMKNRYGGPLRKMISADFHLKNVVGVNGNSVFQEAVIAYPAITVIQNCSPKATNYSEMSFDSVADSMTRGETSESDASVKLTPGDSPWLFNSRKLRKILERYERAFQPIENVRCKVGIGVATGADKVYISEFNNVDIEPDRLLPLVMTSDIKGGRIEWKRRYVLNPFDEFGNLIHLEHYPNFAKYIAQHEDVIRSRNVAKRNPLKWYRTIDKIHQSLQFVPKLLIPDIKGSPQVTLDTGEFYPHHNLYFVTTAEWDIRALQAVLSSTVCRFVIKLYSTKMRGGYLRFQAQYLRRLRLPMWVSVEEGVKRELRQAAIDQDEDRADRAVQRLFGFSASDWSLLSDYSS